MGFSELRRACSCCNAFARHINLPLHTLDRITFNPRVMGGKPCLRGLRVTVGTVVGMVASGHTVEQVLKLYPYLEADDVRQALACAAWRAEEFEAPLAAG